jgi:hypothetical protein
VSETQEYWRKSHLRMAKNDKNAILSIFPGLKYSLKNLFFRYSTKID